MTEKTEIGRLAFRVEGNNWNAYFAKPDTMDGAIFMGTIPMGFVTDNPERKRGFMDLMKACFDDFIQGSIGQRPEWSDLQRAPEHERSGHA